MKYIVGFFKFWRSFIIGDDNRVAITVMWAMLATYAADQTYLPSWFIVPLIIIVLFVTLFVLATTKKLRVAPTYFNKSLYALALPLIAVTVVPVALFRLYSLDFQTEHLLLPLAIVTLCILLLSFILGIFFDKFPALTSFVAGLLAFFYILFWKPLIIVASEWLTSHMQNIVVYTVIILAATLLGLWVYRVKTKARA